MTNIAESPILERSNLGRFITIYFAGLLEPRPHLSGVSLMMDDIRILAVRLPKALAALADSKAKSELISTSAFIRRLIASAVVDQTSRSRFEKDQTSFG